MTAESGLVQYKEADLSALREKEMNPETQIFCPCRGEKLEFRVAGSSYEVKCPTKDCIKLTVRGI